MGTAEDVRGTSELSTCMQVVEAVAATKGIDPIDLSPLGSWIDPDALESLCTSANRFGNEVRLQFEMDGCNVFVSSDGTVRVTEAIRTNEATTPPDPPDSELETV